MRVCDLCGLVDDGPRHIIAHAPGTVPVSQLAVETVEELDISGPDRQAALAALFDTTLQIRHIACCGATGCELCSTPTLEED